MNASLITNAMFMNLFSDLHLATKQNPDAPSFSWFLGSGTVMQSRIPMGRDLVNAWLRDAFKQRMHLVADADFKSWIMEVFGNIPGFSLERAANYLPYIYRERFRLNPSEGCREIEHYLTDSHPSVGFSVLASLMTNHASPHRISFTTYFDDVLPNAIAIYGGVTAIQCSYESFMSCATKYSSKRPIVAKLQRDLIVTPKLDISEIAALPSHWEESLHYVFETSVPIFIGYGDDGGSGGNIMPFLAKLKRAKHGMFWLYKETATHSKPSQEVQEAVSALGGHLVPILGFDEIMLQIWEALAFISVEADIRDKSERSIRLYREQFVELSRSLSRLPDNSNLTAKTTRDYAQRAINRWREDERL